MKKEIKCRELDFQNDYRSTKIGYEIQVGDVITCYAPQFRAKDKEVYPISKKQLQEEIDLMESILRDRFEYKRIDQSEDLGSNFEIISIKG